MVPAATARPAGVDRRELPVHAAGDVDVPFAIAGMGERVDRDTAWAEHSHPTHELLWNGHGASSVTVGTRTWTITPQLGLWVPAGVLHSGFAPAGTWYRTTHFSVRTAPQLSAAPVAVAVTPLLRLLLQRVGDPELSEHSRSLTEAMVLDVVQPAPNEVLVHRPESALLAPIVMAVTSDPGDQRSLADWADELGVSTRTIARAFQDQTDLSFTRWVGTVRAQHAVALLAAGVELELVAEHVGYRSVSAFGAAFRRTTGLTPGRFKPPAAQLRDVAELSDSRYSLSQ